MCQIQEHTKNKRILNPMSAKKTQSREKKNDKYEVWLFMYRC